MTARAMQRRSAKSRWRSKTAEEKRAEMSALAKTRWAKTKRKPKYERKKNASRMGLGLLPRAEQFSEARLARGSLHGL